MLPCKKPSQWNFGVVKAPGFWYSSKKAFIWLWVPFSFVYALVAWLRLKLLLKKTLRSKIPVVVVGNLTVGGTGKTPLVIELARLLQKEKIRVGIVSRGYKGRARAPTWVEKESDVRWVGDEALLFAQSLGCPIVIGRDRKKVLKTLVEGAKVDLVLSDDGLQHYGLERNLEIAIIDGKRRFGNGYCLPAGPLREPVGRLRTVDWRINNGGEPRSGEYSMCYVPGNLYCPKQGSLQKPLTDFSGTKVHAVAGIGNPEAFFDLLSDAGIEVIPHPYPDHAFFQKEDICFEEDYPVLLTEKDAVKCAPFLNEKHWVLPIQAKLDPIFKEAFLTRIKGIIHE